MCGLTGIFLTDAAFFVSSGCLLDNLQKSIATIGHRGPDSTGFYVSEKGNVGLGHARLSIIDLAGGQQPLHDAEHQIHAVVNGELYDYDVLRADLEAAGAKFLTGSDSELVIHLYKLYGVNMLSHLRGEFAFVLYDQRRDWIFAARDRFGIKPLYYTVTGGRLLIASEMKALRPLGWNPEWDVESIVQMGDYNDDRTVFKGVFKLPAGHYLTLRRSSHLRIQSYWDHNHSSPSVLDKRSMEDMVTDVRQHMVNAVRSRLRSDVPLGVYLSGGIDSAAVAGIAASLLKEQNPDARLATFTLSFPGRADLDEGPIAQRMAEFIGADVHMVQPTEADMVSLFERSVWHAEQPVFTLHGAGKIILSNFVREQGYTVVLTGEGADETFGGYRFLLLDYLRAVDTASEDLKLDLPTAAEAAAMLQGIEAARLPQDHISISDMSFTDLKQGRAMLGGISAHRFWSMSGVPAEIFSPSTLERYGCPDHARTVAEALDPKVREKAIKGQWHPLDVALYSTTKTMLSNGILNYVGERAEMASSIEGRPPFLDHKLVEYVDMLPPSVKIMPMLIPGESRPRKWAFVEKWILREAVRPFVTDELYTRKKSQYNVPIQAPHANGSGTSEVVLTPLQALLRDGLTKESVDRLGWADWEYVEKLLDLYLTKPETPLDGGLDKNARILLCVLSFVIMQKRFDVPTAVL